MSGIGWWEVGGGNEVCKWAMSELYVFPDLLVTLLLIESLPS